MKVYQWPHHSASIVSAASLPPFPMSSDARIVEKGQQDDYHDNGPINPPSKATSTTLVRSRLGFISGFLSSIRPFRGIVLDIRARAPYYFSDWTDAWNYRVIPATLLIFFAKCVNEHSLRSLLFIVSSVSYQESLSLWTS